MDDKHDDRRRTPEDDLAAGLSKRGLAFQLAAVVLVGLSLSATGFLMFRWLRPSAQLSSGGTPSERPRAKLFRTWPADRKPDVVLMLTGQQQGYLQPCGCSRPQLGGLERRYNFVQEVLRKQGWPVVAADLGDIAQHSSPQALIKYRYSMEALKVLGYTGISVGKNEVDLGLLDVLAEYALNNPVPRVLDANLANKAQNFPNMVESWKTAGGENGVPKVAFVGATAHILANQAAAGGQGLAFEPLDKSLKTALDEVAKESPDLSVLLLAGELREAEKCAEQFPQFPVIVYATAEEEPPQMPSRKGKSLLIGLGHKGRYVGLVGAFRQPNGAFQLHYQLAAMEEAYETAKGKDADNPILDLLQRYATEVKEKNFLAQYPKTQHPLQLAFDSKYVGSARCESCHPTAYKIWEQTPHSHAYQTLADAKRPSLRQFDGECIVCHVTGFQYKTGFSDAKATQHLEDNGCENCHGPGSAHLKDRHNPKILALMNPYKTQPNETPEQSKTRMTRLNDSCQKCHDVDNDVNWNIKKWSKIIHMTPPEEKKKQQEK
jgi:hypothetical protein